MNGQYRLNNTTTFDDAAEDVLTGGAGLDWFLMEMDGAVKDKATDAEPAEVVQDVN